jgi:hypothetical protein
MARKVRMRRVVEPVLRCAIRAFFSSRPLFFGVCFGNATREPIRGGLLQNLPALPRRSIHRGWLVCFSVQFRGAAPSFLVTVFWGHNGEDQPPKISRRRSTRFEDRAESEKMFKRESDIAQRDFPGRVDATEKIYASLRAYLVLLGRFFRVLICTFYLVAARVHIL